MMLQIVLKFNTKSITGFLKTFQVTKSFLELGVIKGDSLFFYEPFEKAFLEETEAFYKIQSRKFMVELNTVKSITFDEYMNKVHLILSNETKRVENYFDKSSAEKVMKICEKCLVGNHLAVFNSAFDIYLANGCLEKIDQLYDLIKRFPDELELFSRSFQLHAQKEGEKALSQVDDVVDAETYMEKVITVSEQYGSLIKNHLGNNEAFHQSFEKAMKVFVNENAAVIASPFEDVNGEMLAKYCDKLLSNNSGLDYPENIIETKLHHAWKVFKVLSDKDGFQKFYENISARRLIFKLSRSEKFEKFIINNLRDYFGEQDSKSLREIVENMNISADFNKCFMDAMVKQKDTKILKNFSVAILSKRSCK